MRGADICNDGYIRLGYCRELFYLAASAHSHLHNHRLIGDVQLEKRERKSYFVIEIAVGFVCLIFCRERNR